MAAGQRHLNPVWFVLVGGLWVFGLGFGFFFCSPFGLAGGHLWKGELQHGGKRSCELLRYRTVSYNRRMLQKKTLQRTESCGGIIKVAISVEVVFAY